ncbi:MAG: GIY-YIG nuclease family protein [Patescibacteria group bacterium]
MFIVYAIYNQKHHKIYIGQTESLLERLQLHNEHTLGGYTSRFDGEWVLVYSENVETRKDAIAREKQLKSYRGREFVRKYIPRWRSGSAGDC